MKAEIKNLTIEDNINTFYREYAIYALTERGIPSLYDGLSNVQRLILLNTPERLEPVPSLIGLCYIGGYHHGDMALANAISRLARSVDNSMPLLDGYGFFGNNIAGAAAPRYIKCKISPKIKDIIKKYAPVNELNDDKTVKFLNMDFPLGLCTTISGIAPAYRSQILPRKMDEMLKYLDGKKADLTPYFADFRGLIKKSEKNSKSWIISSNITVEKNIIHILDLPPMMRYDTFLEKLNEIIDKADIRISVSNNSSKFVDVKLKVSGSKIEDLVQKLRSITSIAWSEDVVFVSNEGIVKYECVEHYLDDFKIFRNNSRLKLHRYELEQLKIEEYFFDCKVKFLRFMLDKKRSRKEIEEFMQSVKDKNTIERLKNMPAWRVSEEEYEDAKAELNSCRTTIDSKKQVIEAFITLNDFELKSKSRNLANV